jgi:hypothetical protein
MPTADAPAEVRWLLSSQFPDGRRFVTDRRLLLEAKYVQGPFPADTLAPEKVEHFLAWRTTHGFELADLRVTGPEGHYRTPRGIVLNPKYIDFLKRLKTIRHLHFRGSGERDPVIIFNGERVIGALVPMIKIDVIDE